MLTCLLLHMCWLNKTPAKIALDFAYQLTETKPHWKLLKQDPSCTCNAHPFYRRTLRNAPGKLERKRPNQQTPKNCIGIRSLRRFGLEFQNAIMVELVSVPEDFWGLKGPVYILQKFSPLLRSKGAFFFEAKAHSLHASFENFFAFHDPFFLVLLSLFFWSFVAWKQCSWSLFINLTRSGHMTLTEKSETQRLMKRSDLWHVFTARFHTRL